LKRVQYALPMQHERWSWERVAAEMQGMEQCLVIVNTRTDALRLLDVLHDSSSAGPKGQQGLKHLSTLLCGAHRREVLHEVRRRLHSGDPCHLISTQVVEAGVDLDFPMVLRAVGPLDRIVQAAGRCNREGRLATGTVVIFWPEDDKVPPGAYRTGTDTAITLLNQLQSDLHDPSLYQTYFERLYQGLDLDAKAIQGLRQALDYPEVAQRFRLIDDDTEAVVVPYKSQAGEGQEIKGLLGMIREQNEIPRWAMRRLQPYLVNVRSRLIPEYHKEGFLYEIAPGLWEWLGGYDSLRGIVAANRDPAELVI
jgi:CRISPR-associated endonuclease/helicase Cas3